MKCCQKKGNSSIDMFQLEDYYIDSIVSGLNEEERFLRKEMIRMMINGESVPVTETIKNLENRNIISTQDGYVASIYPISAKRTDKKVRLGDKSIYAMCALDAIGCAFCFGQEIEIEACFQDTQQPLHLTVSPNFIRAHGDIPFYVLYPDLRQCTDWSSHCCSHMHFFTSVDAMATYIKEQKLTDANIIALDIDQAFRVARWIFHED